MRKYGAVWSGNHTARSGLPDAHTHLMFMGQLLEKTPLGDAENLTEIQSRLRDARPGNPDFDRTLGYGWLFSAVPSPSISLEDALRFATLGSAYACDGETVRGCLETGKLADFIVLDTNPFERGAELLLTARIMLTVVGGSFAYELSK
ncbi:amidohydrolase family protein [Lysinibacter sp. HNR]|uniref:amidohydrolase family protein n=1 Tax=Lysinibacter sp. HNR TaxID=3031408 RepID=UPI00243535AD|nr:amidohydrolase family protein [Lysinibacter sp. HNR]WGD37387.1 amidohydrolase family protein [Lysinibacter sp. HNR]